MRRPRVEWEVTIVTASNSNDLEVSVRQLEGLKEAEECARLMAGSEPWITLRRDYDLSLKFLTDPAREVYVAVVDGRIVGFMILIMRGAFVGFIQTIAVEPEWRSRGIGSKLMEFAEDRIFAVTPNVFMCVSSFNKDAQRLYDRLGYEVVGELRDLIVPGHSEILLRKTIGPTSDFRPGSRQKP
jgi:ribosomal protein S18 acetylase RimI-like enzyme